MKQKKLIKKIYTACFTHDEDRLQKLRRQEFQKIFKRRAQGKTLTLPKWTLVRV
jgi:hypothetical protein